MWSSTDSGAGTGDSSANRTASCTCALASSSTAFSCSSVAMPRVRMRPPRTPIGSRSIHFCTSSLVRYLAGSATEWPRKRYVFASRKKGRLSFRARLMAWRAPAECAPPPEEARGGAEGCRGPAPPAAAPGRAPEELGHRAARVTGAREVVRVLAVGGDDVVRRLGRGDGAHRDRLLPDVEVEEAAHLPLRVGLRRGLLEAAGGGHLAGEGEEQGRVHGVGAVIGVFGARKRRRGGGP